jgi:hypothetical protein
MCSKAPPSRRPTASDRAQGRSGTINLRDVPHAGFKVVGDKPLKLLTVHVVDKGAPLYDDFARRRSLTGVGHLPSPAKCQAQKYRPAIPQASRGETWHNRSGTPASSVCFWENRHACET